MNNQIETPVTAETQNLVTPDMFTRVNNDGNGNPRYVIHFLNFVKENDTPPGNINEKYAIALKRAKTIGGRKFSNKQYGGGIIFQSYSLQNTCKDINELMK